MTPAALIACGATAASAALLALLLWRGRSPGRLLLDALAIGVTLGAAVAVALAPFELKTNPLHFSPQTLAFLFAGLPEEGVKLIGAAAFLSAHYLARGRRDIVFAAGALSLGFAALENVFYLANAGAAWATLALERALTATPFHVLLGLAGGFVVASLRPGFWGVALGLMAWLGLGAIHGVYDFAVFAGAAGGAPDGFRRAAAVWGGDADVTLRALLCAAEAAAALAGGAAVAALPAPRALGSRGAGWILGLPLAGGAAAALGAGAVIGAMLETADWFLRAANYAIMPLALGVMFIAEPAPPASAPARRALAGAGVLVALALAAAAGVWGPELGRRLLALRYETRAARLAARGDYNSAIDAYGHALAIEPRRFEALAQRAEAFAALKRYESALADIDAALRAAPGTVALYVERADVDRRRNDPAAAARDLDAALQSRPGDPQLLAERARARLESGDAQGAQADLAQARRAAPDNSIVRRVSAASALDAGDLDAALRDLNAVLHANPADAAAAFQRGRIWLYKQETARARADFIRADMAPDFLYPALWRYLAESRMASDEIELPSRAPLGASGASTSRSTEPPAAVDLEVDAPRGARSSIESRSYRERDAKAALLKRLRIAPENWPAPVARMLTGEIAPEAARAAAADTGERCEADFYFAMSRLDHDSFEASAPRLRALARDCPAGFIENEGAKAELRRIAP